MADLTKITEKDRERDAETAFEGLRTALADNKASYYNGHTSFSTDHLCILGPYFFNDIPEAVRVAMPKENGGPNQFQSVVDLMSWPWRIKSHKGWPSCFQGWSGWVDRLKATHEDHWKRAGINEAIMMSTSDVPFDRSLVAAGLGFWNSATNTMDLAVGMMSPTLLDVAAITGFKPHGKPVSAVSCHHVHKKKLKISLNNVDKTYSKFLQHFKGKPEQQVTTEEHIAFLLFWLCRFVFCVSKGKVTVVWAGLAEALATSDDVALGPIVLAYLYRGLRKIVQEPYCGLASGPIWLFQMWLQVYFPQLAPPHIVYSRDHIMGAALIAAVPPSYSVRKCFKIFHQCASRSDEQWSVCLRRTHPSFLKLFGTNVGTIGASILTTRDLHFGAVVGKGSNYKNYNCGAELYCPSHFSRQLGRVQHIPVPMPVHSSVNWYSSCRRTFVDKSQVQQISRDFESICTEFKQQPYTRSFKSTEIFRNWWETKMKTALALKSKFLLETDPKTEATHEQPVSSTAGHTPSKRSISKQTAAQDDIIIKTKATVVINLDDDDTDEEGDEYDDNKTPIATILRKRRRQNESHESSSDNPHDYATASSTPATSTHISCSRKETWAKNVSRNPINPPSQFNDEASLARNTILTFENTSLSSLVDMEGFGKFKAAVQVLINSGKLSSTEIPMLQNRLQDLDIHLPDFISAKEEMVRVHESLALLPNATAKLETSVQQCFKIKDRVTTLTSRLAELEAEIALVRTERDQALGELNLELDIRVPIQRIVDRANEFKERKMQLEIDMRRISKLYDVMKGQLQSQLGLA